MQKGQSTFDYLILTAVILVVIVPLLFFSTGKLDQNRIASLQDALGALKDGITQINNLGFGTSSVIIVQIPKGVVDQSVGTGNSWCELHTLCYRIGNTDLHIQVPADMSGVLPLNEGFHYVQLFNNGTHVLLYECGNNMREGIEQCDGADSGACRLGTNPGTCGLPSSASACSCNCLTNNDCRLTTGRCDTTSGVCVPCDSIRNTCPVGQLCLGGKCTDQPKCGSNDDCEYPSLICNKNRGVCEPCDIPPPAGEDPTNKDCNLGHTCQIPGGGVPSYCGNPGSPGILDFSLDVSPSSMQTPRGGSVQTLVTVRHLAGPAPTVSLSSLQLPPGTTASFSPDTCDLTIANACDSTATFATQTTTSFGNWNLLIQGIGLATSGGSVVRTAPFTLNVICTQNNQCNYPNQVCLSGSCQPCIQDGQCSLPNNWCDRGICRTRTNPLCGNNVLDSVEECELVNNNIVVRNPVNCPEPPTSYTSPRCNLDTCRCEQQSSMFCGNNALDQPEQCDAGSSSIFVGLGRNGDPTALGFGGCDTTSFCTNGCVCQRPNDYCGDGRISGAWGEQCDPGATPSGCPVGKSCTNWCTCRPQSSCGDGFFNPQFEECELGVVGCSRNGVCLADCTCVRTGPGNSWPGSPGGPGAPNGPGGGPQPGGSAGNGPFTQSVCELHPLCTQNKCQGDCSPGYSCQPSGAICDCLVDATACTANPALSCGNAQDCVAKGYRNNTCENHCCVPNTPRISE